MPKEIDIHPLAPADARALSLLLSRSPQGYLAHFHPFPFDSAVLERMLKKSRRDRYWGIWVGRRLAGFFMLRGRDAGFKVPSYGVFIARKFSSRGLSRLALQYAICWCRVNRAGELMLKCHPENQKAMGVYESFGFEKRGVDIANDNFILRKML